MIKVVAFDYAGVVGEGPMSKWIRENILPGEERYLTYKEKAGKWDTGQMDIDEVYKALGELTGIPYEKVWDNFYENSKANPEVVDMIKKLRKKYKVILFSNFVGEMLNKLLDKYQIKDLFHEIIISSDHKMKKPDPEFFELLEKISGVTRDEIVFIDDKMENVEAANAFGIKTFQYIDVKQLVKDLKTTGVKID
jgi:epoxide hydrolase-like predicted phosphatase